MDITSFSGNYRFLSNFYPCKITLEGITYPSSEHAYVAYKTLDIDMRKRIAEQVKTANDVKKVGRSLELREDWEKVKFNIMTFICEAKFKQNPDLMKKLRETGHVKLIEGNTWGDRTWGECPIGNGKNWLGKILMGIRDCTFERLLND